MNAQLLEAARSLTPEERWSLIEQLQASLETDYYDVPADEADAMAARARDWRAGAVDAAPWADVRAALDQEFRL